MAKRKELGIHKENPFLNGDNAFRPSTVKRRASVKANRAILNTETGEVEDAVEVVRVYEVDDDKFVKLYTQNLRAFFSLKPSTFKMVEVLLQELQKTPGSDKVYLNLEATKEYFENHGVEPIAKTSFHRSIMELIEKDFIAMSTLQHLYFINPAIFFNGDRVRFANEYRRKSKPSKYQQMEMAGQQKLPME